MIRFLQAIITRKSRCITEAQARNIADAWATFEAARAERHRKRAERRARDQRTAAAETHRCLVAAKGMRETLHG